MRKVIIGLVILSGVFFAVLAIILVLVLQKAKEIDWTSLGQTETTDTRLMPPEDPDEGRIGFPEGSDLPGTETDSGAGIYDEDFETALMKRRLSLGNDQSCISGEAISGFSGDPIIGDLDAEARTELVSRLESVLASEEDAEALTITLETLRKPLHRLCVVSDDLAVALTRINFPMTDGEVQYRYDLVILPKDVFDEFSVEEGDTLYGGVDSSVVLWADIDDSSINELPAVAIFEDGEFTIRTWDVYSIDTFFGEFDHIESCGVTAVGGVKKIACDKIYE